MDNKHYTGMLCPIWTLSHNGDHGVGDLATLRKFLPWVSKAGIDFLQLLPVNECDQSNSPYSAISSIALDPIYLDLSEIPGLSPSDTADGLPKSECVDYTRVRAHKDKLLRKAFETFYKDKTKNPSFEAFQTTESDWLSAYSMFRFLMALEDENPSWKDWNAAYNTPTKALNWLDEKLTEHSDTMYPEIIYYEWLQWHCHAQWHSIRQEADRLGVKLMGDIPVGVSYNSADVFFEPENFQLDWFGGAPPETFFKDDPFAIKWGQNWGIPLYDDEHMRKTDFAWWQRRVRKHTEIFSMFRIDHILGLYRIYSFPWHPSQNNKFLPLSEQEVSDITGGKLPGFHPHPDDTEEHSLLNLKRGDEIISFLMKAANGAEIIGEDLGMTPDYVRPHLKKRKLSGFRICHWEGDANAQPRPAENYPYYSFSTFSTHDHPPIASVWNGFREALSSEDLEERNNAQHNLWVLGRIARLSLPDHSLSADDIPPFNNAILWGLIDHLLNTSSKYAAFMITDILGTPDRFNTPATTGHHNWTHRLAHTVEEFSSLPKLIQLQEKTREAIKASRYSAETKA